MREETYIVDLTTRQTRVGRSKQVAFNAVKEAGGRMEVEQGKARWVLLTAATLSMMLIGLYQYSWTLFVKPLQGHFGWGLETVQLAFTLFVWIMTWTQPVAGYIADRRGPRLLTLLGGALAGTGWVTSSLIDTPEALYLTYGLGGIGVGMTYATSMGLASKWFPERRGLANGFTSFGYGFGAAVMNPLIAGIIASMDFRAAFLYVGGVMLVTLVSLSFITRYPPASWLPPNASSRRASTATQAGTERAYSPKAMIKTRAWWQVYLAFFLTAGTGLMVTSQLNPMGQAFNLSQGIVLTAAIVFPIFNGLGRIFGGWVSDRLGREVTMTLFFTAQGVSTLLLLLLGANEVAFITIICLIGLCWGPIFTFFPSITADYYGRKHATTNYGLTYTAKAWGGVFGGYVVAWLVTTYESFTMPIVIASVFGFTSALLVFPRLLRSPHHPDPK
jgi:OFA family oxalate/formate antiporter-like MFS transporter